MFVATWESPEFVSDMLSMDTNELLAWANNLFSLGMRPHSTEKKKKNVFFFMCVN